MAGETDFVFTNGITRIVSGYEAFVKHMQLLEDAGVTTEPHSLFGEVTPPEETFDDPEIENPWSYTIVVDEHLNIPIPDWQSNLQHCIERMIR